MAISLSLHFPHLKNLVQSPLPSSFRFRIMSASSSSSSSMSVTNHNHVVRVPELNNKELDLVYDQMYDRYSLSESLSRKKRSGEGTAIVWFRNDLRVLDNEALYQAWSSSRVVLPVYCVDPRLFGHTHVFRFPKTGALRANFLIESLEDLRRNLMKRGLNLMIQHGKPEDILPSLAKAFGAHNVYAHKETCSEELKVERLVASELRRVMSPPDVGKSTKPSTSKSPKLQLIWGSTMYHVDDLPFNTGSLPDVYTQFRKSVEYKSTVRGCIKMPTSLGPMPEVMDWGCVPSFDQLGLHEEKVLKGMRFVGGETAAIGRLHEYFWKKDLLKVYKVTRNGMLGPDYSTKFSPWLASGSLSPRLIHDEVKRYEKERQANDSTYWVLFELIWRDYFRFLSLKYGNSLFQLGGPRKLDPKWSQDQSLFKAWKEGSTGYPLIDANMKELSSTGFMSNRGRQIVCSFLVRDMGIDWRMGAKWFETCLLDYDPCSNYGNWTYGAGVGNDPREDRYFSIPKQAKTYDPDGEYVAYWLPQLQVLAKEARNFPGSSYLKPIVPLKFGNIKGQQTSNRFVSPAQDRNYSNKQLGRRNRK